MSAVRVEVRRSDGVVQPWVLEYGIERPIMLCFTADSISDRGLIGDNRTPLLVSGPSAQTGFAPCPVT